MNTGRNGSFKKTMEAISELGVDINIPRVSSYTKSIIASKAGLSIGQVTSAINYLKGKLRKHDLEVSIKQPKEELDPRSIFPILFDDPEAIPKLNQLLDAAFERCPVLGDRPDPTLVKLFSEGILEYNREHPSEAREVLFFTSGLYPRKEDIYYHVFDSLKKIVHFFCAGHIGRPEDELRYAEMKRHTPNVNPLFLEAKDAAQTKLQFQRIRVKYSGPLDLVFLYHGQREFATDEFLEECKKLAQGGNIFILLDWKKTENLRSSCLEKAWQKNVGLHLKQLSLNFRD